MRRILSALPSLLPDFRDLHVYGGLVLIGVAGSVAAWSWVAVGVVLWYLGVFRMK